MAQAHRPSFVLFVGRNCSVDTERTTQRCPIPMQKRSEQHICIESVVINVVVQGLEIDHVGGQIADQIRTEWFAEPRILAEEELRRLEAQKAPDE